jgi:predicted nucleic acid-binding protein
LIAADSSSLIAYLEGEIRPDTDAIDEALAAQELVLPPPVLVELLSTSSGDAAYSATLSRSKLLDLAPGYWFRAREARVLIRSKGLKAKLADTLIAQCCIDADVPLIAHDGDFRHFAQWCGLKLAL